MEKIFNDTHILSEEESRLLIQRNFDLFLSLVDQATDFVHRDKYEEAAVYADMAAFYAMGNHCGIFTSSVLEQIILKIGQKAIDENDAAYCQKNSPKKIPRKIFHVASDIRSIGGLTKMIWRWIQQDNECCHSLVLTRQGEVNVPVVLRDAVSNSGGKIFQLNNGIGGFIHQARRLREIAMDADIVILHISNHDIIPMIAFANKKKAPPILYLNHADQLFWIGVGVSDLVINLRESGMHLSLERRGVELQRNVMLPIILESTQRVLSRQEAKRRLGIPENSIVLLSIARAVKYRTIDGKSYAELHVPILEKYKQAILIVVGSGERVDWEIAKQITQGRIISYSERTDTDVFYQAADIYVDSFPFVSTTSLLEAGSYSIPLVSLFPYTNASEILGADMPGLDGNLIRVHNIEEYTTILSRLIEDRDYRLSLGDETRNKIIKTHVGENWQHSLNKVYAYADSLPPIITSSSIASDQISFEELDILLPRTHDWNLKHPEAFVDDLLKGSLKKMPFPRRLTGCIKLIRKYGFSYLGKSRGLNILLPNLFRYILPNNI